MGQANKRGTLEERRAQAIARQTHSAVDMAAQKAREDARLDSEDDSRRARRSRHLGSPLGIASLMSLIMGDSFPYYPPRY